MIAAALRSIYTFNLGVKRHERVLVFTDTLYLAETVGEQEHCRRERLRDIAILTSEIGKVYAKKIIYEEFPATGSHGSEPPEKLWCSAFGDRAVGELRKSGLLMVLINKTLSGDGMLKAAAIISKHKKYAVDAVIALSNYSTSHTQFRNFLTGLCGSRYASMPLFDFAMIEEPMGTDWKALSKKTLAVAKIVNRAESLKVTAPNGLSLPYQKKAEGACRYRHPFQARSLRKPSCGRSLFAPLEGTAQGRLVLEWAPTRQLKKPITLLIKDGVVQEVSGDEPFTSVLNAKLDERPENRNIAELGIGTNSMAKRPDNILESEKILGTIHLALGDNSSFGGKISTPFHQDFVLFRPTVILVAKDGSQTCLLNNGVFY